MSKSIFLVLTSAIAIDGSICRADSVVEVSELEAKNFLSRGKARLATAADGVEAEADDEGGAEAEADDEGGADLSKMTKPQLTELATKMGIEPGELTKAQLVEAIEANKGAE